jgi:hypothetical protein
MINFWSKVDIKTDNECWNWTAYKLNNEYGRFWFRGKLFRANRVAWILTYGEIPDGLFVLHKCDNRSCVNPGHLFLGTAQDNTDDMIQKNRALKAVGEKVCHAKLTTQQIHEIWHLKSAMTQAAIAKLYNIHPSQINCIFKHKTWKHIKGTE